MKYLLIFLFLFSTHSFSGELDGKGIECNSTKLATGKTKTEMWWFNNNTVQRVYVTVTTERRVPDSETLNSNVTTYLYSTTADEVKWLSKVWKPYFINHLNRKTLEYKITDVSAPNYEIVVRGTCRVLTGFEEVIKRQDELFKEQNEVKRKREEEYKKAREGNKI